MISVICPVLNEEKYIQTLIDFFLQVEPEEKELLLVDGGSTDNTIEIIKNAIVKNPNIYLFFNEKKYVPFALNIAINNSTGDPIVRLDAHTEYSIDYFEKIIETFEKTGADIVGGPTRVKSRTSFQEALGMAICSPFGIGDSKVHNQNYNGYSDHVTFGAWRRYLFNEIGFFDEQLIRNQDDEFHYRAVSMGRKVYLSSDIKLWYYPRSTFYGLIKQYFQYGYFKPIVLAKVKSQIKLRHLVPSFFVVYLIILSFMYNNILFVCPLILYVVMNLYYSFFNKLGIKEKLISLLIFPSLHLSYGIGFIAGLKNILLKINSKIDKVN